MKVLIVYAHPEPKSFNGAMKDLAVNILSENGHEVIVSDLYQMNFNPVIGPNDFTHRANESYLQVQVEQDFANMTHSFEPLLQAEHDKVLWCDLLIFQFPLWWFTIPAILKGWVDRVFSLGFAYGTAKKLAGKKAMCALSTGGMEHQYVEGMRGTINQILWTIHKGTFAFVGMHVLPPFVAYRVARITERERTDFLDQFKEYLINIEKHTPLNL